MRDNDDGAVFSDDQTRMFADVLDDIIPAGPDGNPAAAGRLGLAGAVETELRKTPGLHAMIAQGLSALDELARRRGAPGFTALDASAKTQVMAELAASQQAFAPVLILHTFAAYYQDPRVVEALGLEARPPHPKGYEMEANDLTLLDAVRRRPKLYSEC